MQINKIVNHYRTSNTFIIEVDQQRVILIDVGGPQVTELVNWLSQKEKTVAAVFLTHEHADHCIGVDQLYAYQEFELFCSALCAPNIANSRQNFSVYTDEIPTFEVVVKPTIVKPHHKLRIGALEIVGIETPGHSPGGMCYIINEQYFFSGDTVLNGTKTPLIFPHSNKQQYKESLQKISKYLRPDITIYPGHGDDFFVNKAQI